MGTRIDNARKKEIIKALIKGEKPHRIAINEDINVADSTVLRYKKIIEDKGVESLLDSASAMEPTDMREVIKDLHKDIYLREAFIARRAEAFEELAETLNTVIKTLMRKYGKYCRENDFSTYTAQEILSTVFRIQSDEEPFNPRTMYRIGDIIGYSIGEASQRTKTTKHEFKRIVEENNLSPIYVSKPKIGDKTGTAYYSMDVIRRVKMELENIFAAKDMVEELGLHDIEELDGIREKFERKMQNAPKERHVHLKRAYQIEYDESIDRAYRNFIAFIERNIRKPTFQFRAPYVISYLKENTVNEKRRFTRAMMADFRLLRRLYLDRSKRAKPIKLKTNKGPVRKSGLDPEQS